MLAQARVADDVQAGGIAPRQRAQQRHGRARVPADAVRHDREVTFLLIWFGGAFGFAAWATSAAKDRGPDLYIAAFVVGLFWPLFVPIVALCLVLDEL